jgi:hypothetical protein
MGAPTPFSLRLTTAVAVFNCLFIASPQGAQQFVFGNGAVIGALQLDYAQLVTLYAELRHQDIPNQEVVLDGFIATAITTVSSLMTTVDAIVETGDAGVVLQGMQTVVANALGSLKNAQSDEGSLAD